jgi:nicotinamide phosphoribosyltransferase
MEYYGAKDFVAASVPATEHAVATSNILGIQHRFAEKAEGNHISRLLAEQFFMKDLITRKFPKGIVSYVADSFDFWAVLTEVLPDLRDVIMARESNGITPGKLVVRPDSGDPVQVVCGMRVASEDMYITDMMNEYDVIEKDGKYFKFEVVDVCPCECCGPDWELELGDEVPEHEVKGAIEVLWEIFGGTVTSKGYKLLDEHIGLIYGDSITTQRCLEILERLEAKGFASGNVTMGIGSYTYQMNSRDTFGFAVKATYTEVNGKGISIFKDPKTDSKKKSARGLLFVGRTTEAGYFLDDDVRPSDEASEENLLRLVFKDGRFVRTTTLEQIRMRLEGTL